MAQKQRVQKCTMGELSNSSSEAVTLCGKKIWDGYHHTDFPETIEDGDTCEFNHNAVTRENKTPGSVVGLVYKRRDDGTKWVVAWSNPEGPDSKVYTDIYKQSCHWDQIKNNLDKKGKDKYNVSKFGYNASIEIDPKARSPTLIASFESAEA